MEVFRLSRESYAIPLNGIGSSKQGARWNSIGTELIYVASNRSLAMAEVAVHFSIATAPIDYVLLTIHIPDDIDVQTIPEKDLPIDWNAFPHPQSTKQIGDKFFSDNKYCILRVPSSVTAGDISYVINPKHPDFSRIRVLEKKPFKFDDRLF